MFIVEDELKTHLRSEQLSAISRNDDTIAPAAIDGAISETKSYLGDYDTEEIFSKTAGERHPLLLIFVKDIAVWHFIILCNVGTQFEIRQKRYDRAIKWLEGVQAGKITIELPKKTDADGNATKVPVKFSSNPKRTQHF